MQAPASSGRHGGARPIGLIGAMAIGIGGMVGGGIFAVLGEASELFSDVASVSTAWRAVKKTTSVELRRIPEAAARARQDRQRECRPPRLPPRIHWPNRDHRAENRADDCGNSNDDHADLQRNTRPINDARKNVAAGRVGAKPVLR